jgi:O-antigen ligase
METARVTAGAASICVLAAVIPLAFTAVFSQPYIAAKEIVLVAGAAVAAVVWLATARMAPKWSRPGLPGLVMAVFFAAAWVRAPRPDTGIDMLAAAVLCAVAMATMTGVRERETLAAVVAVVGVFEALLVLCQALAGDPLFRTGALPGKWAAFGTFGNPNWTAEFLAMTLLVTLGGKLRFKSAALAVMAAGLAATIGRGAWLACAVGAAAMAWARRGTVLRWKFPALSALAGAAAVLALRPDTLHYLSNSASIRGRVWMWLVTLRMIAEHPLGVGLGGFELRFPEMQAGCFQTEWGRPFLSSASFTPQAHNDYLQFAAEAGIPALLSLGALIWWFFRRGRALVHDGTALGCWAAVVAMLVNALGASPFYLPGTLGTIAILLGAALAAGTAFRPVEVPRLARAAACAAALAAGVAAFQWCGRRAASEEALQRAANAIALERWDDASRAAGMASKADPGRLQAWSMAGRAQLARREYDAAVESYSRAAALGYDVEVWAGKASALWHAGRGPAALETLEELARLRPDLAWPRERLAELRRRP